MLSSSQRFRTCRIVSGLHSDRRASLKTFYHIFPVRKLGCAPVGYRVRPCARPPDSCPLASSVHTLTTLCCGIHFFPQFQECMQFSGFSNGTEKGFGRKSLAFVARAQCRGYGTILRVHPSRRSRASRVPS